MLRRAISIMAAWALVAPAAGVASAQSSGDRKPTAKEQVLAIPTGFIVEVKTHQNLKLRGRIGEATDESFAVQTVRNDKVEVVKIAYPDVKSIKAITQEGEGKAGKSLAYGVLGGLAAVGALVVVAAFAAAGS